MNSFADLATCNSPICSRCNQTVQPTMQGLPFISRGMPGADAYLREGESILCASCMNGASPEQGLRQDPGFITQKL